MSAIQVDEGAMATHDLLPVDNSSPRRRVVHKALTQDATVTPSSARMLAASAKSEGAAAPAASRARMTAA